MLTGQTACPNAVSFSIPRESNSGSLIPWSQIAHLSVKSHSGIAPDPALTNVHYGVCAYVYVCVCVCGYVCACVRVRALSSPVGVGSRV